MGMELTEKEKTLISLMCAMNFPEDQIAGICACCEKTEVREKLLEYLRFKGQYATVSDALRYSGTIRRAMGERYQYLPHNMYVRFIRDTTDELIQGDYYYVDTVYGLKEDVYYLLNEKEEMKEYPASDFIHLKTSLVTYVGIPGAEVIEGCKIGEKYRVAEDKGYYFVLENGCSLPLSVVECEEFVPAESKHMEPMDYDAFLHLLRGLFEFGNMFQIYNRLTDSTEYCSDQSNRYLLGRERISKYIENISRNRVRENAFTYVVLATATEDYDEFSHSRYNCRKTRRT